VVGATPQERIEAISRVLDGVMDPEIPVVSITDLGIVRDVRLDGDTVDVALTPTYSGCPATRAIQEDVVRALHEHGEDRVRVSVQLAPPWSTTWMTQRGRQRLREAGIAPPEERAYCPRCGSGSTRQLSQFGSTPCKALFRCDACDEPFEYVKPF
jgi:ring-1,2-phenylacetyl-CoA epoxidase subunit PaaD